MAVISIMNNKAYFNLSRIQHRYRTIATSIAIDPAPAWWSIKSSCDDNTKFEQTADEFGWPSIPKFLFSFLFFFVHVLKDNQAFILATYLKQRWALF